MDNSFYTYYNHEPKDYNVRINNYGYRKCTPGFSPGYVSRKHYVIHYIYEGECIFESGAKSYRIYPGQMFIITPGNIYNYTSSHDNPCTYRWVDISGTNFEKFVSQTDYNPENPVVSDFDDNRIGKIICEMTDKGKMSGKEINAYSWLLADAFCIKTQTKQNVWEKYIEPAVAYIISNSEKKTSVSDVADYLSIDRSYLSRVFNEYMGVSIKKYIYDYHMDIAKSFLTYSNLPIKDIASAIGYDDPLDFTKAFHRSYGVSPTKWREENAMKIFKNNNELEHSRTDALKRISDASSDFDEQDSL